MVIIVDAEGGKAVTQLCDLALKAGGIQNLREINNILSSIQDQKKEKKKKDG